ncbi:MFS transporter [Klebsiella pneumoniae]|uniref:MFS transporter n=1 Tax=Klebsiella pneumoniae TaxID=573 RepID=UPI001BAA2FBB|nr:MFS transporter [Klebsiella pneumoniae]MBQ5265132.1 MFS transporter [Klebsiella pneumoniae]
MIYIIRFFSAAAWSFFYPFMAVWLNSVVGLSSSAAGIVVGFAIVANRTGALAFHRLLDKTERKTEIALTLMCVAISASLMLVAAAMGVSDIFVWIVLATLFGLTNSVSVISQISYIVHIFHDSEHERVLSYENVAANAGAGIAPFLASFMLSGTGYWFVAFPMLLGTLAAVATRPLFSATHPMMAETKSETGNSSEDAGNHRIIAFMVINFLTMIGYAQFYYVFPTWAVENFSSELVGTLFLLSSIIIIIGQVYITSFSQRISHLWRVVTSNLCIASGCALLIFSSEQQAILYFVVVLIVTGEMICGPLYQAQAVKIWRGRRSVVMAIQTCVWGTAEATATVAGLLLIAGKLSMFSFLLGGLTCFIAAIMAWLSILWQRPLIGIETDKNFSDSS